MPTGEALLSGYYLNELVLRLLARDDPHAQLFDAYAMAVRALASGQPEIVQPALRAFEMILLREIGLLPMLNAQTMTLAPLDEAGRYCLVPEGGLRLAGEGEPGGLAGRDWLALQAALDDPAPFGATARACASRLQELRPQLRGLLNYHCGVKTLQTRQLMMDLQNL